MGKRNQIIVVEDDLDDQQILAQVFEELQVKNKIIFFDDASLAYNYLMSTTEKPFLIICDINLPKMNGIELKQKIDKTDLLRRKAIPFIYLTTAESQAIIDNAYSSTNLQGYFKKEASLEEIKSRMKCILEYWYTASHPYTNL